MSIGLLQIPWNLIYCLLIRKRVRCTPDVCPEQIPHILRHGGLALFDFLKATNSKPLNSLQNLTNLTAQNPNSGNKANGKRVVASVFVHPLVRNAELGLDVQIGVGGRLGWGEHVFACFANTMLTC